MRCFVPHIALDSVLILSSYHKIQYGRSEMRPPFTIGRERIVHPFIDLMANPSIYRATYGVMIRYPIHRKISTQNL